MEAAASFGAYIHKRRKALDMTQEELARCVGCSTASMAINFMK
jgi:transcriptional regulator with XRE-family HTH domain